jgi:hypothetical protein
MVLSKENGDVLGLVDLKHMKTMFFLFSVILVLWGLLGVVPQFLAVFDGKMTADKMIILRLMNDVTLALNNQWKPSCNRRVL